MALCWVVRVRVCIVYVTVYVCVYIISSLLWVVWAAHKMLLADMVGRVWE